MCENAPETPARRHVSSTSRAVVDRTWLARPAHVVAPDLIGVELVAPAEGLRARIVETEAYEQHEPASHSFRGPTPSTQVMWGPAGLLYTYFTYGMHWCANVVTGEPGEGQAVLLRAAEPLEGLDVMRSRRETGRRPSTSGGVPRPVRDRDLLRGPARLAQAFGLGRAQLGMDLLAADAPLHLAMPQAGTSHLADAEAPRGPSEGADRPVPVDRSAQPALDVGPRTGVRLAADLPWRFSEPDSPWVSPYRRHPRADDPR